MLTIAGEFDAMIEWDNLNFFLRHAVLPNNVSTAYFDAVDYIFIQLRPDARRVKECSHHGNVRTVIVPKGPCDLCAHARVVKFYGLAASGAYSQLILLNSGVRGPFVEVAAAGDGGSAVGSWVDIVSGAGGASWAGDTVTAPLISFEQLPHPQSYFLSVPRRAIPVIAGLFDRTCKEDKNHCIGLGEVQIGATLFEHGMSIYSLGGHIAVHNYSQASRIVSGMTGLTPVLPPSAGKAEYQQWVDGVRFQNPTWHWSDPCRAVFVKFGGVAWRSRAVPTTVIRAIRQLTIRQLRPAVSANTSAPGFCSWVGCPG
jgi:hypothetical protein